MKLGRAVTLTYLYSGTILFLQAVIIHGLSTEPRSLAYLGVAVSVLAIGFYRYLGPTAAEDKPEDYGAFTYMLLGVAVVITITFAAQILLA